MKLLKEVLENKEYGISPDKWKTDITSKNRVSYDEMHQTAQQHLTGNISHIGKDEKNAIGKWTTPVYRSINNYMRGNGHDDEAKTLSEHLTKAVQGHSIPNSTWGYRGVHGPQGDNLAKLKPGDTFHNSGFASTTLDPNRATHFAKGEHMLAIHIPKGQKALYVSHPKLNSWTSEREMLLPHNTHFKYLGHETITAPHYHYTGEPTGQIKKIKLHHVEVIPHSTNSIQLDR